MKLSIEYLPLEGASGTFLLVGAALGRVLSDDSAAADDSFRFEADFALLSAVDGLGKSMSKNSKVRTE